jgi:gliding motility-associated-like protein
MKTRPINPKNSSKFLLVMVVICLFTNSKMSSQTIDAPVLTFSRACATPAFNQYAVSSRVSSLTFAPSNQFILELSNESGDFTNPTQVAAVPNPNPANGPTLNFTFAFPVNLRGDNFKLRIITTNPVRESPESVPFSYYYYSNNQLVLNNYQSFNLCQGQQRTVSVTPNNEPAYRWYKDMVLMPGETGPNLSIIDGGFYYATVELGSCTINLTNAISNSISVGMGQSSNPSVVGANAIDICEGLSHTFVSQNVPNGSDIQWFKDSVAVTNAGNNSSYTTPVTGAEGSYNFEISNVSTGCDGSSNAVVLDYLNSFQVNQIAPANRILIPGQTQTLEVTVTAGVLPSILWYRDGIPIANSNILSINVNQAGSYYAEVTNLNGCSIAVNSAEFQVLLPTSYDISIRTETNYVPCQNSNARLELEQIVARTNTGGSFILDPVLFSLFNFQWKENGNNITGATLSSFEIQFIPLDANFTLEVYTNGLIYSSNALNISLSDLSSIISASSNSVCSATPVTLEVQQNNNWTYQWYREGVVMTNFNSYQAIVTQGGNYTCEVSINACSIFSPDFTLNEPDSSSITIFPGVNITINEGGSETIVASGGNSYQWFDFNNTLISNSSSITVSEAVSLKLIVSIDGCDFTKSINVDLLVVGIVPNFITPNGDGINETWVLPDSYNADNVSIMIYNANGQKLIDTTNYSNNWPQSLTADYLSNPIFYYVITRDNQQIKKGTITVLK